MNNKITQFQELALPQGSNLKHAVYAGLCILALLVSMYVYFVGKIVFDVIGRRTAMTSVRASQSTISSLEASYFNEIKGLDLAVAESIGLSETHHTLYANRTTTATAVGVVGL